MVTQQDFNRRFDSIDGKLDALYENIAGFEQRLITEQRWMFGILLTLMLTLLALVIAFSA